MSDRIAILNCRQAITMSGSPRPRIGPEMRELGIVADGALLIDHGRIAAVGRRQEIEERLQGDEQIIDAGGRIVAPGFVDTHTHPVFAGTRAWEFEKRALGMSYRQIAAEGGGIRSTVEATRATDEESLLAIGRRYAERFLRCGTTTVEAKSGYGLTTADELKILRVIRQLDEKTPLRYISTFLGAHVVPAEFRDRPDDYVDLIVEEMLPAVSEARLAEFCDVFCEEGAFTLEQSRRILSAAGKRGLKLRVHADQMTCNGGAELAAELGAVTADHLEQTEARGIAAMKQAGVQPVLLPASVLMLGANRYPEARAMIDAGLAVVLATDFNPGTSPTVSMPLVMSLAVTRMKMTPAEALTAATINAACSLGRGHEIGSLEPGKIADVVIYDCQDYRELSYFAGLEHAWMLFAGKNPLHPMAFKNIGGII